MTDLAPLLKKLSSGDDNAFEASDNLARIGSEEVVTAMVNLLESPDLEIRFLASRTLGLIENNENGLAPLMLAIHNAENASITGDLMMALEGFDVSTIFLDLFKLYLFGSFKVSRMAKELLDFKEFEITPRLIRKAQKHWNHYSNNVKQDEAYLIRKKEVEEIFEDLNGFLEDMNDEK
ncbi:MAG: HEAT repeat domain-containing protein [Cyclobacteriaceae bacterium]|nr:HEAT repeat domain-containing protein [Cyclobacteriaceae bacterium]